jgi:predicted component of type VI protein secretion system
MRQIPDEDTMDLLTDRQFVALEALGFNEATFYQDGPDIVIEQEHYAGPLPARWPLMSAEERSRYLDAAAPRMSVRLPLRKKRRRA